jgi:hypothetical protein
LQTQGGESGEGDNGSVKAGEKEERKKKKKKRKEEKKEKEEDWGAFLEFWPNKKTRHTVFFSHLLFPYFLSCVYYMLYFYEILFSDYFIT